MIGELFLPHDMPEQPKESFFKGLFGGGSRALDREELCKSSHYFFLFLNLFLILIKKMFQLVNKVEKQIVQ